MMNIHQEVHQYGPTLDALPANIAVVGVSGRILLVNQAWRTFAKKNGVAPEKVSEGANYLSVCDHASGNYAKEAKLFAKGIRLVLAGEKKAYMRGYPCHSPGQKRWFIGTVAPLPASEHSRVLVVHANITKLKKAEDKLKQLNAHLEQQIAERTQTAEHRMKLLQNLAVELIEAEEQERRRIADLLHDDLQQLLASAKYEMQSAIDLLPGAPKLKHVERLLSSCLRKSRSLTHELSPGVLYHSELSDALEWLCRRTHQQFGIHVELDTELKNPIMDTPLKIFIFRSIKELLFNIAKHAGVKYARVALTDFDAELTITVSDKGAGFDPFSMETVNPRGGLGLLSIRERASYIGGSMAIESAYGKGSQITLKLPLTVAATSAPLPQAAKFEKTVHRPPIKNDIADESKIRVLFADDHKVMRQGLIRLISGKPDIAVAGEASNGREALELARQLLPDVIVMDISMPEMDGIEATRRIKAELPQVRVVGLSMHQDEHISRKMRDAGAESFVSKTSSSAELLKAIYGND